MRRVRLYLKLVLAGAIPLLLSPARARAQEGRTAAVSGVVRDSAAVPLDQVRVLLQDAATGTTRVLETNRTGAFRFPFLPTGRYSLRVERLGFRPRYYEGLDVRSGRQVDLAPVLAAARGGEAVDTVRLAAGAALSAGPGLSTRLSARDLLGYPARSQSLLDATRLSTLTGAMGAGTDLPGTIEELRVDGIPVSTLPGAGREGIALAASAFPLAVLRAAEVTALDPDVEWASAIGGSLEAETRRGGRTPEAVAYGSWGLGVSDAPGAGEDAASDAQGGFFLSGPIRSDTVTYAFGATARRSTTPFGLALPAGEMTDRVLGIARDSLGLDLPEGGGYSQTTDVLSAFGRLDWQPSETRQLTLRFQGASESGAGGSALAAETLPSDALQASAQLSYFSSSGSSWAQEFRVGFDASRREYDEADRFGLRASAFIPSAGIAFGPDPAFSGRNSRRALRIGELLHYSGGAHQVKLGVLGDLSTFSRTRVSTGEFVFSSVDDFEAGRAGFVRTSGGAGETSFNIPHLTAFLQDRWLPTSGLEVLLGVRFDGERLPQGEITGSEQLFGVTGLENADVRSYWGRVSPRVGFTWQPGAQRRASIFGSAGLYSGATDIGGWDEAIASSGSVRVTRGAGAVGDWPALSATPAGSDGLPTLTLLHPDYAPPRSRAADLGFALGLGARTSLSVAGLYRKTELVPRGADLNLPTSAALHDQYGRPVFGDLAVSGGVLSAAGSGRRFSEFDRIRAINLDGYSTERAVRVRIEHESDAASWFASYTGSDTESNAWTAGALALVPVPSGADSIGWMTGPADGDAPHRLAAGARARVPGVPGVEIGGVFQYRSGLPFTPGFRTGVDANGDGSYRNDPAFVDPSLAGMDAVLAKWPCLGDSSGHFATRNSCRTDAIHSLDLQLRWQLGRVGRFSPEFVVDGLNLIASRVGIPDAALLLVDEEGTLSTDPATKTVAVPLRVNENFGAPLFQITESRIVRFGIRAHF